MKLIEHAPIPAGRARSMQVTNYRRGRQFSERTKWKPNLVLREWGAIVARLLAGDGGYPVNAMYIEYANSAVAVAPPTFDRGTDSGVAYYNSLADDIEKDYLRVATISAAVLSSDGDLFPKGNEVMFFAMTSGVEGVHGKPFSAANDSRVIGAALVSMPVQGDPTQDLILSRIYFDEDDQQPKLDTSEVGVEWDFTLS